MVTQYLLSHGIALMSMVASLVLFVRLVDSRRSTQSVLAWTLGMLFLPFVTIPLLLVLGRRKFPRRAKLPSDELEPLEAAPTGSEPMVAATLARSGLSAPRSGNSFELVTNGEDAYARLFEALRGAQRSIDMTMFILADDAVGRSVLDLLADRMANGIQVRLILDAVGSRRALRRARRLLSGELAEVRAFMPLRHSPIRGRTNLRSHRKLVVVDGARMLGGGMNVANEYLGPPELAPEFPRWRDVLAIVSGPAVLDAAAHFESDWRYTGGVLPARPAPPPGQCGDEVVQVVRSGPDMFADTVYDAFLTGIFAARRRVAIVTPYYVPDEALQHALVLAARRGVRTEVLIPTRSNHRVADLARHSLLRDLAAAGVVVHYYPHGMVHGKALLIDEHTACVGSPNFDMRSLFLNYENAFFVYSPSAVHAIGRFIDTLVAESLPTGPERRPNWLVEHLARLLAPEL